VSGLSEDGGNTWTNPAMLQTVLILEGEYHCAPYGNSYVYWQNLEELGNAYGPIKKWGEKKIWPHFMLSAPIDSIC